MAWGMKLQNLYTEKKRVHAETVLNTVGTVVPAGR